MTKTFHLLTVAMAAFSLFACTKEHSDVAPDNQKTISVMVYINSPTINSNTIGGSLPDGTVVSIQRGMVFFLSSEGIVLSYGIINTEQILAGQLFSGIKTSASEVYIVANYAPLSTTEAKLKACTSKADIQAVSETMVELTGVPFPILANASDLTGFDAAKYDNKIKGETSIKDACVLLSPILSRIEITEIKTEDPMIVSFTMAGLYVDNFFPSIYMACGKGGAGSKIFGGTALNNLNNAAFVHKDKTTPTSKNGKLTPSDNLSVIWVYHTAPTLGGAINIPRLVVVLSSVTIKVNGVTSIVTNKFLTVTGFKDSNNALIQNFEAGKIYNSPRNGFVFKYSDLADTPNPPRADVTVNVEVKSWVDRAYSPEI
ncbi:MAG: hypothetical protein RR330_07315 [Alistipes sp.]